MPLLLARIVVSVILFCAPFFLFVLLSANPDNALILIFPFFGAIPAILAAIILFVPAEALLNRLGYPKLKNVVIPLIGAFIGTIAIFVIAFANDSLWVLARNISQEPVAFWGSMAVWSVLGVVWGLVWRMTEWMANKWLPVRGAR